MKTLVVKVNTNMFEIISRGLTTDFSYQEVKIKSDYEYKRFRKGNSTVVIYRTGKIVLSGEEIEEVENFLFRFSELKNYNGYNLLIGVDETGKGELFGPIVVCGVRITKDYDEVEKIISNMDTKSNKQPLSRYKQLVSKLTELGVIFEFEEIPPTEIKLNNVNKLVFSRCIRILDKLVFNFYGNARIVIDDFGISYEEKEFIDGRYRGFEIFIEPKGDENYLECKTASLISRYRREIIIEDINKKYSIDGINPGSGNINNPQTKEWLRRWVELEGTLPNFVKRWDKAIKKILEG